MVYIGVAPGGHGFRFMQSPNNVIFTSAHALFDKNMFPKCPTNQRSTHERRVPVRPGNVYGESRHPVQQFKEIEKQGEWKKIVSEQSGRSRATGKSRSESVPGSSSAPPAPSDIPAPSASGEASGSAPDNGPGHSSDEVEEALRAMHDELALAQLCREGGVGLINYLLMKAVPPVDENLPDTSNVREWTYRDIACLPPAEQKEWKAACREELEALQR
ncbi:hypothetical protein GY45DRAFT_1378894, partial [Cubamyces sp. BRFM 1775]